MLDNQYSILAVWLGFLEMRFGFAGVTFLLVAHRSWSDFHSSLTEVYFGFRMWYMGFI